MEKLGVMIVAAILIIGICTWVFLSDNGVNSGMQDGYERLKANVREYGYKPGP